MVKIPIKFKRSIASELKSFIYLFLNLKAKGTSTSEDDSRIILTDKNRPQISNRLPAMIILAVVLACLTSCGGMQRGPGQSPESITLPLTLGGDTPDWKVGHSDGNNVVRITEFVRPGQTVENWTELVTVQEFNQAVGLKSVDDTIAAVQKDTAVRCPGSTQEVIQQQPDGALYEWRIVNCKAGPDEHGLGRVLDGKSSRYNVQYAVRDPVTMTPERRAKWIEKLVAIEMVNMPSRR